MCNCRLCLLAWNLEVFFSFRNHFLSELSERLLTSAVTVSTAQFSQFGQSNKLLEPKFSFFANPDSEMDEDGNRKPWMVHISCAHKTRAIKIFPGIYTWLGNALKQKDPVVPNGNNSDSVCAPKMMS